MKRGQVCLANLVGMAPAAHNIVLSGDQMQLNQPIQCVHPGESGTSVLEYLLQEHATVPPERGILLLETWRMRAEICGSISDGVYESRLQPNQIHQSGVSASADQSTTCGGKQGWYSYPSTMLETRTSALKSATPFATSPLSQNQAAAGVTSVASGKGAARHADAT